MSDLDLDTSVIDLLDFAPSLPCENSGHPITHVSEQAASWVAEVLCPDCHAGARYLICDSGRIALSTNPGRCVTCFAIHPPGAAIWFTPIEVIS